MSRRDRAFQVLGRNTHTNNVLPVARLPHDSFTRDDHHPRLRYTAGNPFRFTRDEAKEAVAWGRRNNIAVFATSQQYPFLVMNGSHMGSHDLAHAMNKLGKERHRYVNVVSFRRGSHQQWQLRMAYLAGNGNKAAQCCTRYTGIHSWRNCGRDSQSNHFDGNAADVGIYHSGRSGMYTDVGNDHRSRVLMHRLGIGLPVPGEPWHAELTRVWNA